MDLFIDTLMKNPRTKKLLEMCFVKEMLFFELVKFSLIGSQYECSSTDSFLSHD
jgi:hypothetical protein